MSLGLIRVRNIFVTTAVLLLSACSGGSSDSGMVLEGTLVQGESPSHARVADPRLLHGAGQTIGNVEICALGDCSITDDAGQWGFAVDESFNGGRVSFSIVGHGINSEASVDVPEGASNVVITFQNEAGAVAATSVVADGEEVLNHDHSEHDHSEHEHSEHDSSSEESHH